MTHTADFDLLFDRVAEAGAYKERGCDDWHYHAWRAVTDDAEVKAWVEAQALDELTHYMFEQTPEAMDALLDTLGAALSCRQVDRCSTLEEIDPDSFEDLCEVPTIPFLTGRFAVVTMLPPVPNYPPLPAIRRTAPRRRGAGRPRARSSSRGGDSGDGEPDPPANVGAWWERIPGSVAVARIFRPRGRQ